MKYSAEMIENIKRDYSDKSISRQKICEKYGISSISYLTQLMHRNGGFRGRKQDRRGVMEIKNILADYAGGMPIPLIMEKYNASFNTIYYIAQSRGVKRPRRISRNPDLWEECWQDLDWGEGDGKDRALER